MESQHIVLGVEDKQPCAVRFAAEAALMRGVELRIVHCPEAVDDLGFGRRSRRRTRQRSTKPSGADAARSAGKRPVRCGPDAWCGA